MILCTINRPSFSLVLSRGSPLYFIRNRPKKTPKSFFSQIFILSENENMNPDPKLSHYDTDDKIFEFRPILPLFNKKNITPNIVIKRSFFVYLNFIYEFLSKFYLINWKQLMTPFQKIDIFSSKILKNHFRLFSTLIKNILNKRFIYISLIYLLRVQNDLKWIFSIEKSIQLV